MGTEFFWFFDVIIIAILIGSMLTGGKKGFVAMLLSFVSIIVSFVVALSASGLIGEAIYNSVVRDRLSESINEQLTQTLGNSIASDLSSIDMSKVTVNGNKISQLDLSGDSAGKITLNLDSLDYSKSGMNKVDLTAFGIAKGTDYSKIKVGTVQVYKTDVNSDNIGNVILAQTLASGVQSSAFYTGLTDILTTIKETTPAIGIGPEILNQSDNKLIPTIIQSIIESKQTLGDSLLDNVVKPIVLVPICTLIFLVLFAIISILLSIVIRGTQVINKIPVIGTLNSFLGVLLGIVQSVFVMFIVVICVHMIIILTDNTLIFLNELTIEKTYLFRYIYNFDFLNFIA